MTARGLSGVGLRNLVLAGLAAALAFAAWKDAAAAYWLATAPSSAPRSLRADPRIASAAADQTLFASATAKPPDPRAIVARARAALRSAPLDAAAMRQLALASARAGDPDLARRLVLAERISRREMITEVALVDLAAAAGDDAATLDHLDRLLTVYPRSGATVFPHLTAYLAEPDFRQVLKRYARRPWFPAFLAQAVNESGDVSAVAALFAESRIRLSKENSGVFSRLLSRLIEAGEGGRAKRIAVRLGGADVAALDDFRLSGATANPGLAPLTWRLGADSLVQTRLTGAAGLDVELRPGRPALVAERVTLLPPGDYALEQEAGGVNPGPPALLEWEMRCRAAGAAEGPAWRQSVPLRQDPIRYRSAFRVPGNCAAQHWRLTALATDRQTPARFRIGSLALTPR